MPCLEKVEDVEMKENIEPSTSVATMPCLEKVKDVEMKENIDHVSLTGHLNPVTLQQHSDVQDIQMKDNPTEKTVRIVAHKQKRASATAAEHALYRKLVQVGVKLTKCQSKNKKKAVKIRSLMNITTNPQFLKILDNFSSTAKMLTMMQFREAKKRDKGRRFSMEEKIVALSIMKQSPKGYRFLRKIFILPAAQTLLKLINNANIQPGLNENLKKQIKKATEKMTEKERLCVILFDEMSLKASVAFN